MAGDRLTVRLSDLAVPKGLIGGPFGSSLGKKDYVDNGVPVIRGQNLAGPGRFSSDDFVFVSHEKATTKLARNLAAPGDVVFTQRGTLGQVGLVPEDFDMYVISQSQMRLRVDPRKADARYVYYCFRTPAMKALIESRAIVTGVPHINLGILSDLPVTCPDAGEQRAIADVLGTLDDKFDANAAVLTVIRQMLAALYEQLARGADGGGWRKSTLGEQLEILETGRRPPGGVSRYSTGVPSLGAESVSMLAAYDYAKTKFVPAGFFETMSRGVVQDLDVLLYKDGGRPGEFEPHVSLLGNGFPFDRFCINEHVYRLRVGPPLTQEYLYCWLSSEPTMEEMRRRGTGVAIPGLNSAAVKGLPIEVPPAELLTTFSKRAAPLVELALVQARESRLLAQLRDTLLPPLISGELQVRVAESLVGEAV